MCNKNIHWFDENEETLKVSKIDNLFQNSEMHTNVLKLDVCKGFLYFGWLTFFFQELISLSMLCGQTK